MDITKEHCDFLRRRRRTEENLVVNNENDSQIVFLSGNYQSHRCLLEI